MLTMEPERRTRPAIAPWRWRGHDVCTTVDAGHIRFVARDVLEAVGAMIPEFESQPTHAGPSREHATATTWDYVYACSVLDTAPDVEAAAALKRFLYDVITEIEVRPGGSVAFEQLITPHRVIVPDDPAFF